jgi:hypothetical protein
MRGWKSALLGFVVVTAASAQAPEPPISDSRLSVHTLVREDIFAGFLDNNLDRFARGERNVETLLAERPAQRANLLAWKGGTSIYRAVVAHESGKADEFLKHFSAGTASFAEAVKSSAGSDGVQAIIGGTLVLFADRLPETYRVAAWSQAFDAYSELWKQQGAGIAQMPVHFKGEVLAGLAQSAQRTGRKDDEARFIDLMLTVLQGTPYEATAKEWKADPASAAKSNLTCKTCHGPGRLSARLAALNK